MKEFAEEMARKGMVLDVAIHAPDAGNDERNYHVHMLVTMREITPEGFGNKVREWNRETELEQWKERWSEIGAMHLERAGHYLEAERFRVGHLTLEKQRQAALERGDHEWATALDRQAAKHMGPHAAAMEQQGIETTIGNQNREIEERNRLRATTRDLSRTDGEIRLAYQLTERGQAFADALEDRGLILARVSPDDMEKLAAIEGRHLKEKEAEHLRKMTYFDRRMAEEKHGGNLAKVVELQKRRDTFERDYLATLPWMMRRDGLRNLTAAQRETAQRSYDEWKYKNRHSFENYVSYVQKKRQERPADASRFKPMDFVVVNQDGQVYSITQRNTGDDPKLLKKHLKEIDTAPLLSVTGAWEVLKELHRHRREEALWPEREKVWPLNPPEPRTVETSPRYRFEDAANSTGRDKRPLNAPDELNTRRSQRFPDKADAAHIWEAYNRNRHDPNAFAAALDEHGILLAAVTKTEADRSYRSAAFAREVNRFSPSYREAEVVAIGSDARVYKLNDRTTGANPNDIERLLRKLDRTQLPSLRDAMETMHQRAEAREAAAQLMSHIFPVQPREFDRRLAFDLRRITHNVRYVASVGLDRAERAGRAAGKIFEFGAKAFESLFAPILTPAQKQMGEIAERERRIAAEQARRQRSYDRE